VYLSDLKVTRRSYLFGWTGANGLYCTAIVTRFEVTKGGDLGGLAGADAHCQALAAAVGAGGHSWHAYLSTQARPGQPAVNARDRIGSGPWFNWSFAQLGAPQNAIISADLAELHGDTRSKEPFSRAPSSNTLSSQSVGRLVRQ